MLDLAQLLQIPRLDAGFDISPDGTHVAFAWNRTGEWQIYELEISGAAPSGLGELRQITSLPGGKCSPHYSPNGGQLVYALDLDGSESYHIILHNLQTNADTDLTPNTVYAHQPNLAFSPDGNSIAILSNENGQFALYLLSLASGVKKLLLDLQHPIWDVTWSPNGKWIAVEVEMEASNRGLFVIEVANGKWKRIEFHNKPLNAEQPAWSPDSELLAFTAEYEEWFDIGLYEIQTGIVTWLTNSVGDDISPCWSREGNRIGWVHAEGAANWLLVHEGGVVIQRYQLSEGMHQLPQFTSRGEILFLFESPKQPPDLWMLTVDGQFEQLTNSLPIELRGVEMMTPEELSYDSDGTSVPALLYRGTGDRAVVDIHGGPNWNVQFLWDPFVAHMASRGWTVLLPNYRGSTGYGRAWQNASRFDMGGVDTRDCAAAVQYLAGEGLAKKFAVTGRSHGGYLTMTCLTQFPELWCGGSAVVPFMNWFKSHDDSREDLQHWNIENMGNPEENYTRWYNASPYFFLDKVRAPVQLICGGKDPRCPASDSQDAHDKLVELGKDVELLLYEDEGHSFLKIENIMDSELRRLEFLVRVFEE